MANEEAKLSWWTYVQTKLDDKDWTTSDLARQTGIDRSRFTDWRNGKPPRLDTARLIADAFGAPLLEVLVAAGLLTEQEADLRTAAPDPAVLTDEELLAELTRRVRTSRARLPDQAEREANPGRFIPLGSPPKPQKNTEKA